MNKSFRHRTLLSSLYLIILSSFISLAHAQATAQDATPSPGPFPADWTDDDFAPTGPSTGGMDEKDDVEALQIVPYTVSNTTAQKATALKHGVASFRVEDMGTVAISTTSSSTTQTSGTVTTTVTTSTTSAPETSLSVVPLNEVYQANGNLISEPVTTRPKIKDEDLAAPDDVGAGALGAYGVIRRNFLWGNIRGIEDGWDNAIRRTQPVAETSEETALTRSALRRALSSALASAVPAPQGTQPEDWLAWRMERLMDLGNADLAWQLARPITPIARERNDDLRRAWAEVSLLVGDVTNACAVMKTKVTEDVASGTTPASILPYARQTVMVCQALERGRDGLGLSLAAATADGFVFPPLLQTLLESIAENGPAPKVPQNARAGVLESALYAAYPALIQDDVWPMLPNVVLWRLIRTDALPLALRTQAAEWLVAQDAENLLPNQQTSASDALIQLYGLFNFTAEQLENPALHAPSLSPVMQRSLYWQAAGKGNLTSWLAWQNAAKVGGLVSLGATMPVPSKLMESGNIQPLLLATRQAIRNGDLTGAQAHFNKLKGAENLTLPQLRARASLGVLLATLQKTDSATWLTQWQVAIPTATVAGKQAALAQMALWVELGVPMDEEARASVLNRVGEVPGGAQWPLWQPLVLDALAEGKTAAALAQVASAMPEAGGIVPGWVQPAMRTLSAVGDEDARRRLALSLALSGANEEAPAATATPAAVSSTATGVATTTLSPLNALNSPKVSNSSPLVAPSNTTPGSVLFQFMQGTTPTTDSTPNWLLPPPRVPAPRAPNLPQKPSVPTP